MYIVCKVTSSANNSYYVLVNPLVLILTHMPLFEAVPYTQSGFPVILSIQKSKVDTREHILSRSTAANCQGH